MRCSNCEGQSFTRGVYVIQGQRAPAMECTHCRVLHIDEEAARFEEDRESVRLAVAQRARIAAGMIVDEATE